MFCSRRIFFPVVGCQGKGILLHHRPVRTEEIQNCFLHTTWMLDLHPSGAYPDKERFFFFSCYATDCEDWRSPKLLLAYHFLALGLIQTRKVFLLLFFLMPLIVKPEEVLNYFLHTTCLLNPHPSKSLSRLSVSFCFLLIWKGFGFTE